MTPALHVVRVLHGHNDAVAAVAFSPDGTLLATGSLDKTVKLWSIRTGDLVRTIDGHNYSVRSVAFSPSGETLVAGAGEGFDKGEVKIWDVSTGKLRQILAKDSDAVDFVRYSPSGENIAVVTGFGCGPREPAEPNVRLYDTRIGEVRLELHRENCIAFAPDGKTLAVGGPDCKIKLHDAQSGELLRTLTGQQGNIFSVAFSADGTRLVSGSFAGKESGTITLWDMPNGECRQPFGQDNRSVTAVAFLNGGRTVATDGDTDFCRLWDVTTGEMIAHTDEPKTAQWGPRYFAISPDESLLATGSDETDGAAKLWAIGK